MSFENKNEEVQRSLWRRRLCWLFPLLGFVLSVCYLTWLVETEKAQIETQFSAEAYSTLMSLNHSQLRVFNGTPAERDRPDYDRLHDQLAEIADMHPDWSRCFILKKRVNGDIYFFMDVKPSAQSEVSLPYGEVYTWCPAEIANVFSKPAGVMIGPYEDAYGTWVTALSPHVDPERGNVLCVVGIDMKASAYYLIVFKAVLPWACLCAVLLMILIFWGFFDHRRITLIRPSSSYSALITFVVGVGISLMFFHAFRQIDDSRIRLAFTSLASQKAQKVVSDISTFRSVELKHFEHAVLSMRNYSQEDFDTQFAEVAIIPRKRFWAWAPRVADSYPLTLFSDERVFNAFGPLTVGTDLSAFEPLSETILEAEQTGLPVLSPVMRVYSGPIEKRLLLLMKAVREDPADPSVKGLLLFLLDSETLIHSALDTFPDRSEWVNVTLYMSDGSDGHMKLLAQSGVGAEDSFRFQKADACHTAFVQPCVAFGKTFAVIVYPEPAFCANTRRNVPALILILGFFFSFILSIIVHAGIHLRQRLERLVDERTRSLKKTMDMYERMGRISKTFSLFILSDGTVQAASRSVFDILGYTPEAVCGKKVSDFYPSRDAQTLRDERVHILDHRGVSHSGTQPLLAKDGKVRWFVIHIVPEEMERGGQMCHHATCSDVTDAHEFEVTLRKSEQRFKTLVKDISDIVWDFDATSLCLAYVSPSVFQHLGFRAEEIIGRPISDLPILGLPDTDLNDMHLRLKRIEAGEVDGLGELLSPQKVLLHRDGRKVYLESICRVSKNEETGKIMIRGVSRNVTAKLRLETYNNLSLIALEALVKPGDLNVILSELVEDIRRETGLTSVGVRLILGDACPYVATAGFHAEERAHEDPLFACRDGHVLFDVDGLPNPRCLCGEVLLGASRESWSRTAHGTVWTNDFTGSFVRNNNNNNNNDNDDDDPPLPVCVHRGYRSMIIVPIRIGDKPVGLLKLNSTSKGEFNEDIIPFIEALAFHISESMDRRKIQNYYSLLFDRMSEAVIVTERLLDSEMRLKDLLVMSVNPMFQTVFGQPASDVVLKHLSETLPSVYAKIHGSLDTAIQEDRHVLYNYHDDVLDRDFEMTMFPVGTTEFAIIASDVTEKSEVLRSLQESRRQYAALLANISGIVYRCKYDRDWTMLFMSEGTQEMLGYTPEEFYSGKITYNEIVEKNARELIWENWKAALAEQALFNMEYSVVAKDGERKWVIERGSGVFDSSGKLLALEGIVFDITERKHVEQDLERFATAIEQSRDAVIITNENGVILTANAAVESLTGYGKQEILGRIMAEFESPPIDTELYHSMWKTLYRGQTWEANFPNQRKDGTPYIENVVVSPVSDEAGRVQNFVCICRDVTKELKDEAERESLRNQLMQATKMESVGRLAGGVAHDFNNMLQAILGYAEMALLQIPSEHSAYEDIRLIQSAANRAAELTKQLLVFARRSKKNLSVFGVVESIDNLMALLRGLIESESRLDWMPDATEIKIKADHSQFEQAVTNLCINARDALESKSDGTVKIQVRRTEFDVPYTTFTGVIPPGTYASIIVSDNGSGISGEHLSQMFDPFFTTKAKGKGTGLGLAMVYGIIKSCGGGIAVKSKLGKGTSVELLFPESAEDLSTSEDLLKVATSAKSLPRGTGETVLLVDDEETILLTTQRMLESIGYNVVATTSALEAIMIAKTKGASISLLLTDVMMPELNGPQMVGRILAFLPDLPYLYMSGYTANLLVEQGVPKRSIGNIHKPFTRAMLAEKIHKGLARAEKG